MEGELNTDTKLLSIIIPCYNEEQAIPLFYQETMKQEFFFREKGVELEFIFVNDGSKDGTVEALYPVPAAQPGPPFQPVKAETPAALRLLPDIYQLAGHPAPAYRRIQRRREDGGEQHVDAIVRRRLHIRLQQLPESFAEHLRPVLPGDAVPVEPLGKDQLLRRQAFRQDPQPQAGGP